MTRPRSFPHRVLVAPALVGALAAIAPGVGAAQELVFQRGGTGLYGYAVDVVPDRDGDGIFELLVSAPGADGGATNAGAVEIVSSATGLPLLTVEGLVENDQMGVALSATGDADGDGVWDLATGSFGTGYNDQVVRVWSGATGALLHEYDAVWPGYGSALDLAGDLDGDARGDVVVGGRSASNRTVTVLSGDDGSVLLQVTTPDESTSFGHAVGGLRDLDGDWIGELLVGEPGYGAGGRVAVHSGATGAELYSLPGAPGEGLGRSVAPTGDVTGDGIPDFVAGGPTWNGGDGMVRVFSGADGAELWTAYGGYRRALGAAVAGAGDVDGDGLRDVVVGSPSEFASSQRVYVYRGFDGLLLAEIPRQACQGFGRAVCEAGDWNGDGRGDVVVGAHSGCGGEVLVFSVFTDCDGNGLHDATDIGDGATTDCDANGVPDPCDVAAGAPDCNANGLPDACDGPDCDANGVPDACDLASGAATDCDADGILDVCETASAPFAAGSPTFSPIDYTVGSHAWNLAGPPLATGPVTIRVEAFGNITLPPLDVLLVDVEGYEIEVVAEGSSCAGASHVATLSRDAYNARVADGHLVVTVTPGKFVNPCAGSFARVTVEYGFEASTDCDADGVPDDCELVAGTAADANANGIPDACELERYCSATANSTGSPAAITASGSPGVGANELVLHAGPVPAGTQGLFVYGPDPDATPLGNGTLCIGTRTLGFVLRLPAETSDAGGVLSHALDLALPPAPEGLITPGSSWNFQAWFRDLPAGGAFFDLSDALRITFHP